MSNIAEHLDPQPVSLGELARERHALREMKRDLEKQVKAIEAQLKDNEILMLEQLDAQAVEATRVAGISIAITEQTQPSVTDWDAFGAWIMQNNALYLLQRRPAAGAYREILQMGETIPGVEPFVKRSINMRKA